ncbi:TetR-like C-terminal domain-containing protein [Protaetiibacter larvae]|uniref:TetR-like C-terminal domain-containing protein n=1 Tax=Protaetiibacter larvae TaxID=2592654 RepID=UPI001FE7AAF1|nr:TetR-like C-terminal domain-containing protein [Protaetiibacter larvae]
MVGIAVELVDADPETPLTLAAVATRAGVAVPSLYKHVRSLDALRDGVALAGVEGVTAAVRAATAGLTGAEALLGAGRAIRAYARRHPGLYAASQPAPGREASPELAAAAGRAVEAVAAVVRQAGLPVERTVDAVRILRAAVHGFILLEAAGGFGLPDDVEASYERLLAVLWEGLGVLRASAS